VKHKLSLSLKHKLTMMKKRD